MKKYLLSGIVVLLVLGVVYFLVSEENSSPGSGTNEFEKFSSIPLEDYEGNTVLLEEFQNMPLVINSWAVWCPFCRDELPDFADLQQEFEGEVKVIAIDRQEPLEKVKQYTDELGISDDMLFLMDSSDSFYKTIGGFSMPETIFLNSSGEIVVHKRGPMELEEMREHVHKIIDSN